MRIYGVVGIKGGVGKTTTTVNLAYLAATGWARTLVWDLDPQGASTFYFRIRPKLKGGVGKLLDRHEVDPYIKGTDYERLDLLPADVSCRRLDLALDDLDQPTRGVRRAVKSVRDEYDCVFLDCPPSLSLLSENVFRAADALLVPVVPTTLSLRTLDQLVEFCADQQITRPRILPFFSMVDRRKKLHREIVAAAGAEDRSPRFLQSAIPYASVVEQMGLHRAPLQTFAERSPAAQAYQKLWAEVADRLES